MNDPFVLRMIARTQARRNVLRKVCEFDKENYQTPSEKTSSITDEEITTSTILSKSYKTTDLDELSSEKISNDSKQVLQENSNQTLAPHEHSSSPVSSHNVSDLPTPLSSNSSSPRKKRFQHLAQRTKQLEEWEDDYTYHSVSGGSAKEVETSGLGLHELRTASHNVDKQHEKAITSDCSLYENNRNLHVNKEQTSMKCYYFGEYQTPNKTLAEESHLPEQLASNQFSHVSRSADNRSFSVTHSSNISYSFPHSVSKSKTRTPPRINSKHNSPTSHNTLATSKSVSPTKCLAWDRQLLQSLEAQGFTPTASKSKLAYDFRDRSPMKDEGSKDYLRNRSSQNVSQRLQVDPPIIVSVRSKSNINHDENPTNDRFESSKERERSQSPGKVSDLRSKWEQHIRNSSPERQIERSRSPSPARKAQNSAMVPTRSRSPQKDNFSFSNSNNTTFSSRSFTPSKSYQSLHSEAVGFSSGTDLHRFSRGSDSRASLRSLSPHKSSPCGEVIKGEAPMPEATPIVKNPSASVKERAAAFSSLSGEQLSKKDPAELSLKDRKNLFEKNKGAALIPKAPFGQCVSDKTLQSSGSTRTNPSKSYEAPRPRNPAPKLSKTLIASSSSSNKNPDMKSCSDFANSVVEAQKRRFERLEDNWRDTDINSKVSSERESEMNQLLNRFRKPRNNIESQDPPRVPYKEIESDSEYPESEESGESYEQQFFNAPLGPPKPPRSATFQVSPTEAAVPIPPPMTNSPHSPSKRLNSTELDECYPGSPSKGYVPKVKPGCLFPSLSDIDSHSEIIESDEDNRDSSFAESILTCTSADSLGTRIQAMAQGHKVPTRQLSTIKEGPINIGYSGDISSCSTDEALGAIDDALDEAFDDDEPTPPKRGRKQMDDGMKNSVYKTPKIIDESLGSSDYGENLLTHSVSMYRKQKPAEIPVTPVRQIIIRPDFSSPSKDSPVSPSVTISSRIKELQEVEEHQLTVISQASSAITVVSQHPEQYGTTQHIEAEKLLIVAMQKRQSALHEIQRLKAEGALGKKSYWNQDEDSSRGSISISKITLPLKQDFLDKSRNEKNVYHLLVLVKHRDQVITSQLQTTPDCVVDGAITFPNLMSLHNLAADFNIALEVYGFKVEVSHPPGFKKEHSRLKLPPLKRLHKEHKSGSSPAMVSSPGGPYAVRTSSFQLIGFAHLNINTLTRNAWTLEKVPFNSPMNGHLLMRVAVAMEGGVSESSFLTMFDDVGGFGAWNRRWCALDGAFMRYWSYPDDENKKECLGCLDLRMCTTRKVEQVSRDICARQFTFQLTFLRPLRAGDKSDLIHEVRDNTLITRILMSADSREDRIQWCNKLNKALANIRAWDPDALKPEDFHV